MQTGVGMAGIKVCMLISNSFNPDNRVYRSAKTLIENGYKVTIICTLDSPEKLPEFEKKEGIEVKRVTHWLPLVPLKKKEWGFCRDFLRAAMEERADIYHANDFDTLLIAYRAARKNKAKLVYDSHEYWRDKNWNLDKFFYRNIGKAYIRLFEPVLVRKASSVMTVSQGIANQLKVDLKLKKTPEVVANYINKQKHKKSSVLKDRLKLKKTDKIIVYTGNVSRGRGLEKLIEATIKLPANFFTVIIGQGNYRDQLIEKVKAQKLESRIKFVNRVPYEDIVKYNSSADLGVAPIENVSFSYYHSAPNKLSEYIMSGIPVVVSDFPEMRRVVKKYKVGATVDPDNAENIAKTIREVIKNKDEYEKNTKIAANDLNWEKESHKLIKIYSQL